MDRQTQKESIGDLLVPCDPGGERRGEFFPRIADRPVVIAVGSRKFAEDRSRLVYGSLLATILRIRRDADKPGLGKRTYAPVVFSPTVIPAVECRVPDRIRVRQADEGINVEQVIGRAG